MREMRAVRLAPRERAKVGGLVVDGGAVHVVQLDEEVAEGWGGEGVALGAVWISLACIYLISLSDIGLGG